MFILSNFLDATTFVLESIVTIYVYIIIARAIISWVNPDPYNPIVQFLYKATEPVLARVRRFLPNLGGLDISPLVVILFLFFLKYFVIKSISDLAVILDKSNTFGVQP
jgi:YggT family protein